MDNTSSLKIIWVIFALGLFLLVSCGIDSSIPPLHAANTLSYTGAATAFVDDFASNPLVPNGHTESNMWVDDNNTLYLGFRDSSNYAVYTSNDNDAKVWTLKGSAALNIDLPSAFLYPDDGPVVAARGYVYLFGNVGGQTSIVNGWRSPKDDGVNWTALNDGNPIFPKDNNAASIWYIFWNRGVYFDRSVNKVHMWGEVAATSPFQQGQGYTWGEMSSDGLNITGLYNNRSANLVSPPAVQNGFSYEGNRNPIYIPERNAYLLLLHSFPVDGRFDSTNVSELYSHIRASAARADGDLSDVNNYSYASVASFAIDGAAQGEANHYYSVADANLYVLPANRTKKTILTVSYAINQYVTYNIWGLYTDSTVLELYDALGFPDYTATVTPTLNGTLLGDLK